MRAGTEVLGMKQIELHARLRLLEVRFQQVVGFFIRGCTCELSPFCSCSGWQSSSQLDNL